MEKLKEIFMGKSILYIGVDLYHYSSEIQNKIKEYGGVVTFYPERDTTLMYGFVNRLLPSQLNKYQQYYYSRILKKVRKKKFNYFLVIRGFKMPIWFVKKVKEMNPQIKCIMYQWDANVNSPFLNQEFEFDLLPEFDKVFSFDYNDVKENPKILKYSPLFYTDEIKSLTIESKSSIKYDLFFFGSYLPERYKGLLKIKKFSDKNGYSLKTHFYMPFRYYLIEWLKGNKLDRKLIKHNKMNRNQYLKLLNDSKVIVDVSNEKQSGLAMRVLEAIGAQKKVITTNKFAWNEPGIDKQQIKIIDLDNIDVSKDFICKPVVSNSENDYSIDRWLITLFS